MQRSNYEVTVEGAGKLTITPKPLTAVISGTVSKDYDGKNEVKTPVSVTLSGIYNTDDVTAVVKSAVFTGVNAGEQKVRVQIELDGAKKGNYTLAKSMIEANGKINKAAHGTMSVNDLKAKYGNTATLNLKALNLPEGYTFGAIQDHRHQYDLRCRSCDHWQYAERRACGGSGEGRQDRHRHHPRQQHELSEFQSYRHRHGAR